MIFKCFIYKKNINKMHKIYHPPYGHSTKINYIGKIVKSPKEYYNIKIFVEKCNELGILDYNMFINTHLEENIYFNNKNYYQIIMPKINGKILDEILDEKFDINIYNKLVSEMKKLKEIIFILNNNNIYHMDISTTNLIFTDEDKLLLLDFEFTGESEVILNLHFENKDMKDIIFVLKEIEDWKNNL